MKISLTTRAWAQCHTAFAEVGLAAARPELHKLCRHAANENDAATTESLAKFFPAGAMATSGLRNLVKWLETLGLAKDGRLTKAGSALADDPGGKVYIPEKNLFRLAVLSHAATGTVLCRLTRKAPKELYGTNFAELTQGQTEAIPADCQLTPGSDYIALQDQEAFRFIGYCGGDRVAIRHRPTPLEINLSIQGDAVKAEVHWKLRSKDAESKSQAASPELVARLPEVIQDICQRSPKGRWNGERLEGRFADFTPDERKQFKGSLNFTEGLADVTFLGEIQSAQISELPLRPCDQTEAELWVNERVHLLPLGQPRTRSQLIALINRNLEKHEAIFQGYRGTIPPNSTLAQGAWTSEDPAKRGDYWNLQAPLDLAPREAAELDTPVDLYAPSHRRKGNLAQSTGLTIEHHQLLEYPELLEALWGEAEVPAEILLCDRHMFAYPQSEQLPKLLAAMRTLWPHCRIELWYSDHKDIKNNAKLIEDCKHQGHKVQTIPAPIRDGKIHDRFLLLKHPSRPLAVWGASNTLLNAREIDGKLRWPQVNLTRMKPQQAHTQIRNWAK
jgi:hypothetical protein